MSFIKEHIHLQKQTDVVYPDSDGKPMADNTKQFNWIVLIKENLEAIYRKEPRVFVAGDLLWYPVEGNPKKRVAPDALVVFGVVKKDRGSYQQWKENNVAPQVVFEILSSGNTPQEMKNKWAFYNQYGVEEYYCYDPDKNHLEGWLREAGSLSAIKEMHQWISPRLGIRFVLKPQDLEIYWQGEKFKSHTQVKEERTKAEQREKREKEERIKAQKRAKKAEEKVEKVREIARKTQEIAKEAQEVAQKARERENKERQEKMEAQEIVKQLKDKLKNLGIDPDIS